MPFSLLFSVDSRLHTLFARCSTISARIIRVDYPRPLRGLPAAITWILRGRYVDYLRRSAWNNHGILRKNLSFTCHLLLVTSRATVTGQKSKYKLTVCDEQPDPSVGS